MNDLSNTISELKTKISKLIDLHQQLKLTNEQLIEENNNYKKVIEEQKTAIELIEKKNKDLAQDNNKEQEKIVTETKIKINELVQEIDNCIALLK